MSDTATLIDGLSDGLASVLALCRRKSGARLAELEDLVEQLRIKLAKLEKEKVKLQVEIRDLSIEYETVSAA